MGCGWVQISDIEKTGYYYQLAYTMYVFAIPIKIALFASSISDVMLILNSNFVITERKVWFLKMSKLTNLTICYIFSVCLYAPLYFPFRLEAVSSNEEFAFKPTDFGQSTLFKVYGTGTIVLETILGVCILGILNVLLAITFREKMIQNGDLLSNRTEIKQKEIMYTKMVFILTTICFITRLLDAVTVTLARLKSLDVYNFSDETKSQIKLYYDISLMLLLAAHAFDNWVYFLMDPNLRRCTRELFCRPTTQTTIVSYICFYQLLAILKSTL